MSSEPTPFSRENASYKPANTPPNVLSSIHIRDRLSSLSIDRLESRSHMRMAAPVAAQWDSPALAPSRTSILTHPIDTVESETSPVGAKVISPRRKPWG